MPDGVRLAQPAVERMQLGVRSWEPSVLRQPQVVRALPAIDPKRVAHLMKKAGDGVGTEHDPGIRQGIEIRLRLSS